LSSDDILGRAVRGARPSAAEQAELAQGLLADLTQTRFFGVTESNVGRAVGERLRALPSVQAALAAPLDVAGYAERPSCPLEELFRFHLPLAQWLLRRASDGPPRTLVAIAGLPAGGKSVFTALLMRILDALRPPFGLAAVGLDGYHYTHAYLVAHRAPHGLAEQGPLELYKGAHFTFDAARLAADLARLRQGAEPVALPAYDRTIHDPVEGRIRIRPDVRLVLVEGNYLLYRRDGWERLAGLFDLGIFLNQPAGANREPMIARHLRGGRTREDAVRHFERVDRGNTELIAATRSEADLVIELNSGYAVAAIVPRPAPVSALPPPPEDRGPGRKRRDGGA